MKQRDKPVTDGPTYPEWSSEGMTMDSMPPTPAHARPVPKRDHLWVLVIIAGFAMYDVWEAWTQIGDKSGFAHGTGWTLTVIAEAYWGYSLFALFRAPGPRSRRFAMWSAAAVFAMSAVSQVASHLAADKVPPAAVVGFVSVLPVTVLALIAILIHLRQKDREDAVAAHQAVGAEDERAALRAEIAALGKELSAAQSERDEAQQQVGETAARNEILTRKLTAAAGSRRTRKPAAKAGAPAPATKVPRNVDVQAEALAIIAAEPGITGEELAARVGRSERWGQTFKKNLATAAPKGQDPEE